jgi:hypothetical protein
MNKTKEENEQVAEQVVDAMLKVHRDCLGDLRAFVARFAPIGSNDRDWNQSKKSSDRMIYPE